VAITVVVYLRRALSGILLDLCGTEVRANFWRVFSSVMLVLVPVWCALDFRPPGGDAGPALLQVTAILQEAISGLLVILAGVGIVLTVFISRRGPANAWRANVTEQKPIS
jgi:hypothetical protein